MIFDKFAWHRAVTRDGRIQASHRLVLGDLLHSVKYGSDLKFRVRQDTIAARMNVSLRSVNGAFSSAKRLGYLTLTQRRSTGNGNHGSDEHQLALPESHAEFAHDSDQSDTHDLQESYARNGKVTRKNCQSDTQTPTRLPAETDTPKVLKEGSLRRFSERGSGDGAPSAELEPLDTVEVPDPGNTPSPRDLHLQENDIINAELVDDDPDSEPRTEGCPRHEVDDGITPCHGCRKTREKHEEWQARQNAKVFSALAFYHAEQDAAREAAKPRHRCGGCHDTDVLLMSDRRPGRNPSWCLHNGGGRRPFTDQELIDNADLLARLNKRTA